MTRPVPRIYLDHAATSFPKAPGVVSAVVAQLETGAGSPGRGGYREALAGGRIIADARAALAALLGAGPDDALIFAYSGTDALNLAIRGLAAPGGHVVTTAMDHNSVLRPLAALAAQGLMTWTAVPAPPDTTVVDPAAFRAALRPETAFAVVTHASNVTGVIQPIAEFGEICRAHGVPLIVDAAKTLGCVPLDFADLPVDALAAPGHKALGGPAGTGLLLMRRELGERMTPLRVGGTGTVSESVQPPTALPEKFESGSPNTPALAGLLAAARWIAERGVAQLHAEMDVLTQRFLAGVSTLAAVRVLPDRRDVPRTGVVSLRVDGFDPAELSALLETQFNILTRSGLHCAPLAHAALGTLHSGGATRFSFGATTTAEEIDAAVAALGEVSI